MNLKKIQRLGATLKQVQGDFVVLYDEFHSINSVVKCAKKGGGNKNEKKILFRPIYVDNQIVKWVTVLPKDIIDENQ